MLIEIDSSDYSEMKAKVNMWSVDGVPAMFLTLNFYKGDEIAYCIRVNCTGWDKMFELLETVLNKVKEEYENPSPIGASKVRLVSTGDCNSKKVELPKPCTKEEYEKMLDDLFSKRITIDEAAERIGMDVNQLKEELTEFVKSCRKTPHSSNPLRLIKRRV